ncbi:MAG TPA: hypothetical protein ENH55_12495 [Aurantimonas coralicida]|uniref:Uncharacterized protein n=1 Tax=Aurantimonas coralicida TaxID=182270 RepID=A0A9C9NDQ3_9HYPH|nr:hypothetical protein [Aurantimonas coralicida]HEU00023.1 hypothetical protein [Aurantimonas coralicida]
MNADIIELRWQPAGAKRVAVVEISRISSFSIRDRSVKAVDEAGKIHEIAVREGFFTRAIPTVGDYLIRYGDGHVSHAPPRKLREGGYLSSTAHTQASYTRRDGRRTDHFGPSRPVSCGSK